MRRILFAKALGQEHEHANSFCRWRNDFIVSFFRLSSVLIFVNILTIVLLLFSTCESRVQKEQIASAKSKTDVRQHCICKIRSEKHYQFSVRRKCPKGLLDKNVFSRLKLSVRKINEFVCTERTNTISLTFVKCYQK